MERSTCGVTSETMGVGLTTHRARSKNLIRRWLCGALQKNRLEKKDEFAQNLKNEIST